MISDAAIDEAVRRGGFDPTALSKLDRANIRNGTGGWKSLQKLALLIEKHEPHTLVDPDLYIVRKIVTGYCYGGDSILMGEVDDSIAVQSALAAYKAGKSLGQ